MSLLGGQLNRPLQQDDTCHDFVPAAGADICINRTVNWAQCCLHPEVDKILKGTLISRQQKLYPVVGL